MQDLEERVRELEAAMRWCVVAMVRGRTTRENRPKIVEEVINEKSRPDEAERQEGLKIGFAEGSGLVHASEANNMVSPQKAAQYLSCSQDP